MAILYLVGLLVIFYFLAIICDRYFVWSLDGIAKRWRLPHDVSGATLMAIGSSAPELFTSFIALTKIGSEDIGAGTIIGSAIFNILVIVGASAIVATAYLNWRPVLRDMGFYALSILVLLLTFRDGRITLVEAVIYLIIYAIYIFILAKWRRWVPDKDKTDKLEITAEETEEMVEEAEDNRWFGPVLRLFDRIITWTFPRQIDSPARYWTIFSIAIVWIIVLSWALVECGIGFARSVGMPEVIIALTILAGGTSIPDLLSSIIVAKQGRGDMAVSNAVGSNTFDILICLGLPWLVYILVTGRQVAVGTENLGSSIILLFFTVIAIFFTLAIQRFKIGRRAGYFLILLYLAYLGYAIWLAYGS